jgi:NMD protein affecting ribosome stability and mRNA decay
MSDELLEKIYDNVFKEKVETHLREFIKKVFDIKTDSNYRVLFSVRIVNLNTGNVIDIERH